MEFCAANCISFFLVQIIFSILSKYLLRVFTNKLFIMVAALIVGLVTAKVWEQEHSTYTKDIIYRIMITRHKI